MRLICPNCGAQYEVDDSVIPEAGRDVQCSSCGHTWFQAHPDQDADLADEVGYDLPASEAVPAPEPEPASTAEPEPVAEQKAPEPVAETPIPEADPTPPPAAVESTPPRGRRALDDEILSVLREEAEREQAARRAENPASQAQSPKAPSRGLESVEDANSLAENTIEIAPVPTPAQPAPEDSFLDELEDEQRAEKIAPRREQLPDVEEITSTLSPGKGGDGPEHADDPGALAEARARKGRGFRIGMSLSFAIFAILVVIYMQADGISKAVPQASAQLDGYVQSVNGGRIWIDDFLRNVVLSKSE